MMAFVLALLSPVVAEEEKNVFFLGDMAFPESELPRVFIVPLPSEFNEDLLMKESLKKEGCEEYVFYRDEESGPYASEFDQEVWFHMELLTSYPRIVSNEFEADIFYLPLYFRRYSCFDKEHLATKLKTFLEPWLERHPSKRPKFFMAVGKVCSCAVESKDIVWGTCHPFAAEFPQLAKSLRVLSWEQHAWHHRAHLPQNVVMPYVSVVGRTFLGNDLDFVTPTTKDVDRERPIFVLNTAGTGDKDRDCVHCSVCNGPDAQGTCPKLCRGLRPFLLEQSRKYEPDVARVSLQTNRTSHLNLLSVKVNSTFCLEPPGDTLTRRSFYEDILLGCVPVVFRNDSDFLRQFAFSDYVPYRDMWVYVDLNDVIDNNLDVIAFLQTISPAVVAKKRHLLKRWAPAFSYNLPRGQFPSCGTKTCQPAYERLRPKSNVTLAQQKINSSKRTGFALAYSLRAIWFASHGSLSGGPLPTLKIRRGNNLRSPHRGLLPHHHHRDPAAAAFAPEEEEERGGDNIIHSPRNIQQNVA